MVTFRTSTVMMAIVAPLASVAQAETPTNHAYEAAMVAHRKLQDTSTQIQQRQLQGVGAGGIVCDNIVSEFTMCYLTQCPFEECDSEPTLPPEDEGRPT